jgi:hypothetical protein
VRYENFMGAMSFSFSDMGAPPGYKILFTEELLIRV